ncbi:dihydroorotate oxidase B, electron transfer subunit [Oceanobacillus limi]|uniref:Dihydroorotate dehydrogenase B (NAD(+)), electron transfer subunit n=1 Tax=Oceanobacillus limi TaxID=930131 RepID=A0A1I0DEX5_9BACI|nr:dihydroorotate dehydrogenase electron transfer subunit [Oceanobacillus limi]SET30930.1 dihydroorotate oxidase B, electron transfer subunit [Oceanobacillus limi]
MIKKERVRIQTKRKIAKDTIEMVLENKYISSIAIPGQFIHIYVDGHTLRRPISIANVDQDANTLTILFKQLGSGTEQLACSPEGTILDVLGPSGNGFQMDTGNSTILLIGGGIGVPPLYYLGKSLIEKGMKIISILGFQSSEYVFYEREFQELGENLIVTNDGSYGEKGFVTDVVHTIDHIDCYYSCGPIQMLQAVTQSLPTTRGYISLEERMGCGVGACFACVVPSKKESGYRKICKDGPVFNAEEVKL